MRFSIIIPVYNVEEAIGRCIMSVLNQSFGDFELILIDDGSIDSSGQICDKYAGLDDRVKVIHKTNGGVSSARNTGIKTALGEYVIFVDSDDFINIDYLEKLNLCNSELTILGYSVEDENGEIIKIHNYKSRSIDNLCENIVSDIFKNGDSNYVWAKCFRMDIIKNKGLFFDEKLSLAEDTLFVVEYLQMCKRISYIPYNGYHYIKYKAERLTNKNFTSIETINQYEEANEKIFISLRRQLGHKAMPVMIDRMAQIYKEILMKIIGDNTGDLTFWIRLFKAKWFSEVACRAEKYFAEDDKKFIKLLKTKSGLLFGSYLKAQRIKNKLLR